jgi:hypothetical protein
MTMLTATAGSWRSAYQAARPGDQIVLADGNYGDLDFDRIFPDRRPLIVRARTEGKVRCRIVRVLAGHVIVGIRTCEPPSSDASNEEASC